jgi:hypothetical protein
MTGLGPQTFLQPHDGNLGNGPPLALSWNPTLTYSYLANNHTTTSNSSVSEVAHWGSFYP